MSVLSLEWCSPTKCQAQKQNQIVEFNTIKIEDLYFQEGEKQRDNCDAVISAVSTALGVNFTNNYFVLIRQTPWGGYNTVYTTAQQNCQNWK